MSNDEGVSRHSTFVIHSSFPMDHATPCFAAALSTRVETNSAVQEVCDAALAQLDQTPHLALAFVSQHHAPHFDLVAAQLHAQLGAAALLGCTGEAIVSGAREIEGE